MGKNYIHWNDYYARTFSKAYNNALEYMAQSETESDLRERSFELYKDLFIKSIELLKLYLHNNGLFLFDMYEIIRECYYINFLNDGEEWITLLNIYTLLDKENTKENQNLFTSWAAGNFELFDHLDDTFNKMVTTNE